MFSFKNPPPKNVNTRREPTLKNLKQYTSCIVSKLLPLPNVLAFVLFGQNKHQLKCLEAKSTNFEASACCPNVIRTPNQFISKLEVVYEEIVIWKFLSVIIVSFVYFSYQRFVGCMIPWCVLFSFLELYFVERWSLSTCDKLFCHVCVACCLALVQLRAVNIAECSWY